MQRLLFSHRTVAALLRTQPLSSSSRSPIAMAPKRKASSPAAAAAAPGTSPPTSPEEKPKTKRATKPKIPPPPQGPIYDPSTMRRPKIDATTDNTFTVLSWNVAGLRALLKKDPEAINKLIESESADVLCLQEHKLQNGQHCTDATASISTHLDKSFNIHFHCSTDKKGYSGTAFVCRQPPLSVVSGMGGEEPDGEGRVLTAEFEKMFLVNVYVPNSGEGLKRLDYRVNQWDVKFSEYLKSLEARGKPVVLTGDLNCAAQEIDIHSPKTNLRSAGFTQEERESFAQRFVGNGFIDCFRRQHPDVVGYTYWGYRFNLRAKNKGWRLDYFLASEALESSLYDCYHLPDVMGSDHCPLGLVLKW